MYTLVATIKLQPGHRDAFIKASHGDATGSIHHEPGCVRFDLLENPTDVNVFYLIEAYEDEAAFDAHLNTPHFFRWRDTVTPWFVEPPQVVFMNSLFPADPVWRHEKTALVKHVPMGKE
ncbi:MAG: antibiotic biosynthesis monooxygenase [uncultured bacterium]|nr:MAG: antibiotic biosynthesis monooxygenase [uncultured bacterium]OGT26121.1 MAG: hypothetical protein A3B71_04505 [Gammaproteobacteria bacterium RIFCSPHIGHO2_02_FULL_42_43]OGT28237.1 MAG: hypothetical protein A2624_04570 [Gammaproteobacteria bacterium RIFCSPHIGHO2_01_FULL_42_8]OGT62546.1 MAG: hypothetical protein A3I77_01895 [Gammaproteobacteria bacterium RIFCSPLOWO2_02_FULL_42_14]OGT86529.1 MAG: hypothetical protein A3G86_08415 [Gammaproteobacteria bacterium RIFCSPLOWO2_12_FULL_42_18]